MHSLLFVKVFTSVPGLLLSSVIEASSIIPFMQATKLLANSSPLPVRALYVVCILVVSRCICKSSRISLGLRGAKESGVRYTLLACSFVSSDSVHVNMKSRNAVKRGSEREKGSCLDARKHCWSKGRTDEAKDRVARFVVLELSGWQPNLHHR